ncbi:sensor histidine kinase [Streptomyces sp. HB2AG]|uniref:sensor histidine kinase n=1 Tax=Streptomyces sp. HB2AG TaxID=2983400 RepID=UPI0022AB0290|nr:sensor histidine kinase [Streptomyces sp. HB2AG]MCZ2526775.1 sensor histidine kinase [Streptomyces sp. HB2AG]
MQRLYAFIRRHPTWVDTFWAVCLLGLSLLGLVSGAHPARYWAAVPVVVAQAVTVALRRRAPERMLLLTFGYGIAQLALDVSSNPGDIAMPVVVYTVASCGAAWASRLALLGALTAPALSVLRWPSDYGGAWNNLLGAFFLTVPFVLAWVLGDSVRTRRAYYAQLEERAARLEREREAQSKVAVAAERARIARELHDVVAHNVSVMVVQADGAAYVLDSSPEQAREALGTISSTGRQALAEMRRLLGVLRSPEQPEGGEYVPQPGVDQLDDLVEQVRGAGLPVDFRVQGTPVPLPRAVELTAYRIVQEALTNVRKHGGAGAEAVVRIAHGEDELDVLVEDDGHGADRGMYLEGGADGLGHGLIGMRERVRLVGGTLEAGPAAGGGFRVSARLPLGGER